jgi:general secretion pathway protein K
MMGWGDDQADSGGFALVVVILVMLISSFLASQLILQVRTDLQIAANVQQRQSGRMLAEGGVNLALFRLVDKPGLDVAEKVGGAVFLRGRTYETVLATGKMEYYAVSESGKIDLNATPMELVKKFLTYQGLAAEEVEIFVDSLLDWRDNDDLHRLNGAEASYYEGLDKPYIPRNGKIEDPAEFFLIRGTETLRGTFDPYEFFTVHNPRGKININNLSPGMLAFLVGGDADLIEKYREEQQLAVAGRLTMAQLRTNIGDGTYTALRGYLVDSVDGPGFYSIVANGYAGDFSPQSPAGEEEIAPATGDNPRGVRPATKIRVLVDTAKGEIKYLSWREQPV